MSALQPTESSPSATTEVDPPPVPRPISPAVRRRSWAEPRVRLWLVAAAAMLVAAVILGIGQYRGWAYDSWLVHNGTSVEGTVVSVEGVSRQGFLVPPPADVEVEFRLNGKTERQRGRIEPSDGFKFISPRQEMRLHIDPDNPVRWTARVEADSLSRQFIGVGLLVIVAIATGLMGLLKRRGILRHWRDGDVFSGHVDSISRSATAPHSWCVRWRVAGVRDKRLYVAYVPQRMGVISAGQQLRMVGNPRRPQTALVVRAYV